MRPCKSYSTYQKPISKTNALPPSLTKNERR